MFPNNNLKLEVKLQIALRILRAMLYRFHDEERENVREIVYGGDPLLGTMRSSRGGRRVKRNPPPPSIFRTIDAGSHKAVNETNKRKIIVARA